MALCGFVTALCFFLHIALVQVYLGTSFDFFNKNTKVVEKIEYNLTKAYFILQGKKQ